MPNPTTQESDSTAVAAASLPPSHETDSAVPGDGIGHVTATVKTPPHAVDQLCAHGDADLLDDILRRGTFDTRDLTFLRGLAKRLHGISDTAVSEPTETDVITAVRRVMRGLIESGEIENGDTIRAILETRRYAGYGLPDAKRLVERHRLHYLREEPAPVDEPHRAPQTCESHAQL